VQIKGFPNFAHHLSLSMGTCKCRKRHQRCIEAAAVEHPIAKKPELRPAISNALAHIWRVLSLRRYLHAAPQRLTLPEAQAVVWAMGTSDVGVATGAQ